MQGINKKEPKLRTTFFREICLPGMTEDFHLSVLYHYHVEKQPDSDTPGKFSGLKIVFVCEESSPAIEEQLVKLADNVFADLESENLLSFLK